MAKYGFPYMGSKADIADDLITILPAGKRFVDLFGGGGAMTHAACLSKKWDSVYYNEFNPLCVDLMRRAVKGEFNYNRFRPEFITREKFLSRKDSDGYVKYIWSFGNNGDYYLFGKDIEPIKKAGHDYVVFGKALDGFEDVECDNIHKRRIYLRQQANKRIYELQQLEQLERLQQLELNCGSYDTYKYQVGDIVYCDPPYEGTAEYVDKFDSKAFYDWVASKPYYVFFSSYEISDKRFFEVWSKVRNAKLNSKTNSTPRVERLYCNKPYMIVKQLDLF